MGVADQAVQRMHQEVHQNSTEYTAAEEYVWQTMTLEQIMTLSYSRSELPPCNKVVLVMAMIDSWAVYSVSTLHNTIKSFSSGDASEYSLQLQLQQHICCLTR